MESVGLLILAIIQLITAVIILFWPMQSEAFGIKALVNENSIYRYLLASLWGSVTIIYFLGSFNDNYTETALLLGLINVVFEIISYWFGLRINTKTKTFPYWGTLVMGISGIICFYELIQ